MSRYLSARAKDLATKSRDQYFNRIFVLVAVVTVNLE